MDERAVLDTDRVQVFQAMLEMNGHYPGVLPPAVETDGLDEADRLIEVFFARRTNCRSKT